MWVRNIRLFSAIEAWPGSVQRAKGARSGLGAPRQRHGCSQESALQNLGTTRDGAAASGTLGGAAPDCGSGKEEGALLLHVPYLSLEHVRGHVDEVEHVHHLLEHRLEQLCGHRLAAVGCWLVDVSVVPPVQ